jgi:dihydrofolate reductase
MPISLRLPSITYVVARSWPDNIIGRKNQLPWHLRTDLQRFKQITMGHVIVMGRNTFASIGHPLPGRVNIVLSSQPLADGRNQFWHFGETTLLWAKSREDALFLSDIISLVKEKKEFFVIGGQQLYSAFEDLFNKMHLTEVFTSSPSQPGDALFSFKIDRRQWRVREETEVPAGPHDDLPSRYSVLERKTKTVRYVDLQDYYTDREARNRWLKENSELISRTTTNGVFAGSAHQYHLAFENDQTPAKRD